MGIKERQKHGVTYYVVRYGLHYNADGHARYKERWFRHKPDAVLFDHSQHGQPVTNIEAATIRDLADVWQDLHVSALALRTRNDYRTQLERRILPYLGAAKVQRLEPGQVSAWLRDIGRKHPRSANKALGALKAMMRWGRANGYTTNRAVDDVKYLRTPASAGANPKTPAEVLEIANRQSNLRDRTIVMLAAYSGLRFSEIRAITWADIDMDAATVNVERSIDADGNTKPTKTYETRLVPILTPGMDALKEWREAATSGGLVFTTRAGNAIGQSWHKTVKQVTGHPIMLHELRDTYASILIAAGVGEVELTMWLGHSDISVTRKHYGRIYAKRQITMAAKANAILADL